MFDFLAEMAGIVTGIVCAASFIASMTSTPKDDELLGKLYKVIELMALNVGKAKMLPPNQDGQ
tara:strand:- start:1207 stop:1395 length:189 start_codon:yes stop_codon:yes gene_type:complete